MKTARPYGIAALAVAAGLALSGCAGTAQGAAPAAEEPATVVSAPDGGPDILRLSETAVQRLGIRTAPVRTAGSRLTVPYGAVVYEPDGSAWAYVQTRPGSYQRQPLKILTITGDEATLSSGPRPGTLVVTQGGAELVGVETGIDGEE